MTRISNETPWPSDADLAEFQGLLDWHTGYPLPDGRYLGWVGDHPQNGREMFPPGFDARVRALIAHANPADKSVLELGSCEGVLTVQLAQVCRRVVAVEVRPKNVMAALVRLFLHRVKNCELRLMDARDVDVSIGRFDVLFHCGLLYHLKNPVAHLHQIRDVADSWILDTHYADERVHLEPAVVKHAGREYEAAIYKEHGWTDALSGVEHSSYWLTKDELFRALREIGMDHVEIVADWETPAGRRILLAASRGKNMLKKYLDSIAHRFRRSFLGRLALTRHAAFEPVERIH